MKKFAVVKKIGKGSQGEVYLCKTKDKGDHVAIKAVHMTLASQEENTQQSWEDDPNAKQLLEEVKVQQIHFC